MKARGSEQHRPRFHFSPGRMWMNDPNGLVYFDGKYHLFYQYHPHDTEWGPMHWGHAVSADLVHWQFFPIALYPDELGYIFSGSAVVDWNNTSGFGNRISPPMIAIFTYHNPEADKAGRNDFQTQGIAYSIDKGRSWRKYEKNPVLSNPGIRDFRDPRVIWYKHGNKWIMALAAHNHVQFYSSPNLKHWNFESDFGKGIGAHDGVWECPDLFPMIVDGQQKWVLLVSINSGGPNGGSGTQYFVGEFDGKTFVNDNSPETILWVDWGKDFYAGFTWSDIPEKDGRRILLAWMGNWQYAQKVPTQAWRGAMTIPRKLELKKTGKGIRLFSEAVAEMKFWHNEKLELETGTVSGKRKITTLTQSSVITGELKLVFQMSKAKQFGLAQEFGVILTNNLGEDVLIGYELPGKRFFIDRQHSGKIDFSDQFSGRHYAPRVLESEIINMQLFIDVASVELFADEGQTVMTEIFFPNEDFNRISIYTKNGSIKVIKGSFISFKSDTSA